MQTHERRGFLLSTVGLWPPVARVKGARGREIIRSGLWRRTVGVGLERFELIREGDRFVVTGTILAMDESRGPVEARYEVVCDAGWRTEAADVAVRDATGGRRLRLTARDGRWQVDGHEMTALRGCVDVDLGWSPSTNTLPIRRLALPVGGQSGPLVTAWVRFPDLTIEPLPQAYERTSARDYRYTSRGGSFTAALEVDEAGLVQDYEGVWHRVETAQQPFAEALVVMGPLAERAEGMTLYDPLLGDWDVEVVDHDADGGRRTSKGEWHFAWVLEGRAIQDVFIVPSRGARQGRPIGRNRYGTTLRVYDPAAGTWRVTWINPVSGAMNTLTGRKQGEEIVQEGHDPDGSMNRWTFSEITARSFRWRGEVSTDGGKAWRLTAEFSGRRAR